MLLEAFAHMTVYFGLWLILAVHFLFVHSSFAISFTGKYMAGCSLWTVSETFQRTLHLFSVLSRGLSWLLVRQRHLYSASKDNVHLLLTVSCCFRTKPFLLLFPPASALCCTLSQPAFSRRKTLFFLLNLLCSLCSVCLCIKTLQTKLDVRTFLDLQREGKMCK